MSNYNEQGHAHSECAALYAEDMAKHKMPWELWEYKLKEGVHWLPFRYHPTWYDSFEYRRKTDRNEQYDAVEDMMDIASKTDWENLDALFIALYNAGYRKVEDMDDSVAKKEMMAAMGANLLLDGEAYVYASSLYEAGYRKVERPND